MDEPPPPLRDNAEGQAVRPDPLTLVHSRWDATAMHKIALRQPARGMSCVPLLAARAS